MTRQGDLAGGPPKPTVGLSDAMAWVELELRLAVALRESQSLRLKILGDRPLVLFELPMRTGWISLTPAGLEISRTLPAEPAAPQRQFADLLKGESTVTDPADLAALDSALGVARAMIVSLIDDDRAAYRRLVEWAPVIEASVYRVGAVLITLLDQMRPRASAAIAASRPEANELAGNYQKLANMLGRATLLSTDPGSAWLAEMAATFTWINWTPSFAQVRERDQWSTLIGARSASRFGPAVIDRYFGALERARHPTHALDALIGLAAIGWSHPDARAALVQGLDRELARLPDRGLVRPDVVAAGFADAKRLLSQGAAPRPYRFSRRDDAFHLERGGLPIFQSIPNAVDGEAWRFIPAGRGEAATPPMARGLFVRAWGEALDLSTLPPEAFGRA